MPELPEVETIKRDLEKNLTGQVITQFIVEDPRIFTGFSPSGGPRRKINISHLIRGLINKKISQFFRRGKYLAMEFVDGSALILHLRMTGQLLFKNGEGKARAAFYFGSGKKLFFKDRRRFGEIQFSTDWKKEKSIASLGIEPLNGNLTAQFLKESFKERSASVHSLLLNQTIVCGIGNIYAAEALFRAGIRPTRKGKSIRIEELNQLVPAIQQVLNASIQNRGYSMSTYVDTLGKKGKTQLFTQVYGKEDQPCVHCKNLLKKIKISGRGVVYCTQCQK